MTQENKHTPAPWVFETVVGNEDQTYRIYSKTKPLDGMGWLEDKTENLMMADTKYYPYVPNSNDARLMASAPELLDALEELTKSVSKLTTIPEFYQQILTAEKAIAKARGEA